ncbi:MAG: hypothetical protein ABSD75_04670 [Terriglobales bacterium]|jgi:hypothetical protein
MKRTSRGIFPPRKRLMGAALLCLLPVWASAAELHLPAVVEAGQSFSIALGGSGQATFYLVGPDHVVKRTVSLGSDLEIHSGDVHTAGRYQAILCDPACISEEFEVKAAQPAHLSFFLHPSRVPVSAPDSIDGTAFVFDPYFNLVLSPARVDFRITPAGGAVLSRHSFTRDGVAWMRMGSTPHEGTILVTAVLGKVEEARVIQQVAAEACGLRMKAVASGKTVTLETDPVRDCNGNALPDGTVVSFTKVDKSGKTTVDTPIKKGVARTEFRLEGPAEISVACGVVLGNEVALNGKL